MVRCLQGHFLEGERLSEEGKMGGGIKLHTTLHKIEKMSIVLTKERRGGVEGLLALSVR